jgi:hypothetical protein
MQMKKRLVSFLKVVFFAVLLGGLIFLLMFFFEQTLTQFGLKEEWIAEELTIFFFVFIVHGLGILGKRFNLPLLIEIWEAEQKAKNRIKKNFPSFYEFVEAGQKALTKGTKNQKIIVSFYVIGIIYVIGLFLVYYTWFQVESFIGWTILCLLSLIIIVAHIKIKS